MDIVAILLNVAKLICFGCLDKVDSDEEWMVIESTVIENFGISRTDWISLKQQKAIAQLLLSARALPVFHVYVVCISSIHNCGASHQFRDDSSSDHPITALHGLDQRP